MAPDRLVAEGGSAGGLLIGAVVNMAPERFRVVHAAVPFVDALTTILDPTLPLTVPEWEEWGNPLHDAEVYRYMRSYTPYENVTAAQYPAILATTSLNDTRVHYVEPAKWVARLRDTVTNDEVERPILLRTEMVAGHGGAQRAVRRLEAVRLGARLPDGPGRRALSRRRAQKSIRITTRRSVGRLTSVKPASANTPSVPTWSSSSDHVLRGDRVALDGAGAALAGEIHRGARERPADAALAKARAGEQAGDGPDAVVGLVLRAALPGDAVVAHQALVGGARLDRAPADRLAVEVRDQAAGRARLRMAAVGLLAQPVGAFLGRKRARRTPAAAACTAGTGTRTPAPRVPKTVCRSSQLASLAGTTEIAGSAAVMRTIVQVAGPAGRSFASDERGAHAALEGLAPISRAVTTLMAGSLGRPSR